MHRICLIWAFCAASLTGEAPMDKFLREERTVRLVRGPAISTPNTGTTAGALRNWWLRPLIPELSHCLSYWDSMPFPKHSATTDFCHLHRLTLGRWPVVNQRHLELVGEPRHTPNLRGRGDVGSRICNGKSHEYPRFKDDVPIFPIRSGEIWGFPIDSLDTTLTTSFTVTSEKMSFIWAGSAWAKWWWTSAFRRTEDSPEWQS